MRQSGAKLPAVPDRTTKSEERCDLHPGRPSAAACDRCGRPMCISCAVPVRGEALCSTCLADAFGAITGRPGGRSGTPRGTPAARVAASALGVAVVISVFPWTRSGFGSGPFGAWGARWSLLAALAGAAGVVVWLFLRYRAGARASVERAVLGAAAALVAVGAILALLRPPALTHPTPAPWAALLAGAVALGACLLGRWDRTPGA